MREKLPMYVLSGLVILLASVIIITTTPGNNVTGAFSVIDVAPEDFTFTSPAEITEEQASRELTKAHKAINFFLEKNHTTNYLEDILEEANQSYDKGNYTETIKATSLIKHLQSKTNEFYDQKELQLQQLQAEPTLNLTRSYTLIEQAQTAIINERYDEAFSLLKQSQEEFEKTKLEASQTNALVELSKNIFRRYWWQILTGVIILILISIPLFKQIRKHRLKTKITKLKAELKKTQQLIKRLQKACFNEKKITPKSYKLKVSRYEERIAEIKHTLPVLEAQLKGKKPQKEKRKAPIEIK